MKRKTQTPKPKTPEPVKAPEPLKILNFDQLQTLCTQERECRLVINGTTTVVMVRSLTPDESSHVAALLHKALPPRIKGAGPDGEDMLDLDAPEYKAAKKKHMTEARALAIFLGCPVYRAEICKICGGLEVSSAMPAEGTQLTVEKIASIVQQRLTEAVATRIYESVIEVDGNAAEYADFFSVASAQS